MYAPVPISSDEAKQKQGYEAIYNATLNTLLNSPAGQIEILLSHRRPGRCVALTAPQRPFSQGHIHILFDDPFALPVIDSQRLTRNADTVVLGEGLKVAGKIGHTAPLGSSVGDEVTPGSSVQPDDGWDKRLASAIGTEFPSLSCAMLPQAPGGVLGSDLTVYGLANVRIVDFSMLPIQFSAHSSGARLRPR